MGAAGEHSNPTTVPSGAFHPPEKGPALEYDRAGVREATSMFAWAMGFYVVIVCIMWLIGGESPIGWMPHWYVWLFGVIIAAPFAWSKFNNRVIAGADWLSNGKNQEWLDLYDLKTVTVSFMGTNYYLKLEDRRGENYDITLFELERKPRIWDLVYNGILHSVAHGDVKTNDMARSKLHLDSATPSKHRPTDDR